ncbi:MAG TPA: tripartite tricarboxylate transporter substrate binding protein [Pseudolabrys sp.]|jgi:tripartite-type tricarboxylate transporter receptor subunit TctC|nr:tripartite tricarboxylate transporter substrate binding protein [Pseudolabrys sp.]
MKHSHKAGLLAAGLLLSASAAFAQSTPYPNQTVRIINPFTAGSVSDILGRALAEKLGTLWGQTVIVENKPGISGTISVAKAAPDGYTLISTSNGHTIVGALNKNLGIDPIKDFAGVTQIASVPLVLVVAPTVPAKDVKELVALAKAKPGTLNFTSAGLASSNYLAGEILKQTAKIDIAHVPFRGTPEQFTSLIRGDSQLSMAFMGNALPFIQSGQIKALGIATPKRVSQLPDVPTMAEAGMPDYKYDSWFAIMAPAGTPAPIIKKISEDIASILKTPEMQARWQTLGAIPITSTPAELDAIIRSDAERYGKILQAAGVTPQ